MSELGGVIRTMSMWMVGGQIALGGVSGVMWGIVIGAMVVLVGKRTRD